MIEGMTGGNVIMKCTGNTSDLIRASFKSILTQLSDFSPSDSLVSAKLIQENGKFKARIEIHSSELNITIERCADSPVSLLGEIKSELMDQIASWRKIRVVESHSA